MGALPKSAPVHKRPAPITFSDWLELPVSNRRMELWNGEIVVPPAPETDHQVIQGALYVQLWLAATKLPQPTIAVVAPTDVKLREHTVVQPDIVIVTGGAGGYRTRQYIEGPPDMVVEILSPGNRGYDLVQKTALYAECGIPEYWIVDLDLHEIIVGMLHEGHYQRTIYTEGAIACGTLGGALIDISFLATIGTDTEQDVAAEDTLDGR